MKSTGIVRKIDELGRIVIPKEIRKNLGIKNNEDIEIFVENDTVILKKYYRMQEFREKCVNFINLFQKYIIGNIYILDREKVITSTNKTMENIKISEKLITMLEERKKIVNNDNVLLEISNNYKINNKFVLSPLISNTDLLGAVLIVFENNITETDLLITTILSTLIKFEIDNC